MQRFSKFFAVMLDERLEDKRPLIENNLSDGILVLGMQNRSNANFGNWVLYSLDASL